MFYKTKESNHKIKLSILIFETSVFFKLTGLMHNFLLKLSKNIDNSQLGKRWTFRLCPNFIFDSHCFKNIFKLCPIIVSYDKSCINLPNTTMVMITSLLLKLVISVSSEFAPQISLYKHFFFLIFKVLQDSCLLFSASSTHFVSSVH